MLLADKAIYGILVVALSTPMLVSQTNLFASVMNQVNQINEIMQFGVQEVASITGVEF